MQRILEFFDRMRIINLPERLDRRTAVERELAALGMPRLPANTQFFSALLSHREAIRQTLAAGAQSLLILEEDVFFRRPGEQAISETLAAMQAEPWDVICLGYLEPGDSELATRPLAQWQRRVIGGHFCRMRRDFIERILCLMDGFGKADDAGEILNPTHRGGAFNLFVERHPDIRRVLANPCLAGQRSSRTDLHALGMIDKTPLLRDAANMLRELRNGFRRR